MHMHQIRQTDLQHFFLLTFRPVPNMQQMPIRRMIDCVSDTNQIVWIPIPAPMILRTYLHAMHLTKCAIFFVPSDNVEEGLLRHFSILSAKVDPNGLSS